MAILAGAGAAAAGAPLGAVHREVDVDGDGQINREEFALLKCFWYEEQDRAHCVHAEEPRESWLDGE